MKQIMILVLCLAVGVGINAQEDQNAYKKRVLESTEIDILTSFYAQDGDNAAVSGGIGTEELTDVTGTIVVAIPLNDDDVLRIDAGVSAYTSASSGNVDPFGRQPADPFVASSGASGSDVWVNGTVSYQHSSDDRNDIWSVKASFSTEYDYSSIGAGGSYTKLFNEKNTELGFHANVFIDNWSIIYPIELRPFRNGKPGINDRFFQRHTINNNETYTPQFNELPGSGRQSYSGGIQFSQILSRRLQASVAADVVLQSGLLSTPFQRVYFEDVDDVYIEGFHLADDIERLPDSRLKLALGGRLHYFLNEWVTMRTFYRYYQDDWGITSHTASIEVPVKVSSRFTLYPSYRYYQQGAADYFAPYNQHQSSEVFYTSDFDLSEYSAHQYGFGVSYTDIFTESKIWRFGLKSVDLKFYHYARDISLQYSMVTAGVKFVMD
jgi:hypothetical protein